MGTLRYSRSALDTQEVPDLCSKTHVVMQCSVLQRGGTAHEGTHIVLTACSQVLTGSLLPAEYCWQHVCTAVWGMAEDSTTALYIGYSWGTHGVLTGYSPGTRGPCVVRHVLHDVRAAVDGSHHGEHSVVQRTSRRRAPPGRSYPAEY
jgi:hypothetical protein